MYYASELLTEKDMKDIVTKTNLGIESIEFSISENLDSLSNKIKDYRSRLDYYGTSDLILHGPFLDLNPVAYDSKIFEATAYRFAQCYDAGLELSAKKIIYHTGFIPSIYFLEGWAERMADFWNPFLESRTELQILIENVYDPFPDPIRKVKKLVTAPNFKLCLDIGHANCYSKILPLDWVKCLGSDIGHVHLHDNNSLHDAHQALGTGTIPVKEILSTLKKTTFDATYTIECNTPEDVLSSYQQLRQTI